MKRMTIVPLLLLAVAALSCGEVLTVPVPAADVTPVPPTPVPPTPVPPQPTPASWSASPRLIS